VHYQPYKGKQTRGPVRIFSLNSIILFQNLLYKDNVVNNRWAASTSSSTPDYQSYCENEVNGKFPILIIGKYGTGLNVFGINSATLPSETIFC
jgi:hypothetical protein